MSENNTEKNNVYVEEVSTEKYLTFFIEEELFAIPSSQVVEIIRMQPITFIPKLPKFIIGVINLRGKIVPLIDLRLKFKEEFREYDDQTSIIVAEVNEMNVGLIVDKVNDVADISSNQISDAPKFSKSSAVSFVKKIATLNNNAIMLLNIERILNDKDTNQELSKHVDNK